MVSESWFRSLWKPAKKHEGNPEKLRVGILAFEVASLMSKLVHLWKSLSDKQVSRLRDEIVNSLGIKKLVSEDDEYISRLICCEINENLRNVALTVNRLSKKCGDPLLKSFELAFDELLKISSDPYGWQLTWKKMGKKVKKMERFVAINANLYQEMEALSDLERTLRRMKGGGNGDPTPESNALLVEYEKRVIRKQQEVKYLKEISLWNRSYDYTVFLLARSVFTIFSRVGHVFGNNDHQEVKNSKILESDYILRSQSAAYSQSSVHPTEYSLSRFSSEPFDSNLLTKSGPVSKTLKPNTFYSGPLKNPNPVSEGGDDNKAVNFYSGPLGKSTKKMFSAVVRPNKFQKWWRLQGKLQISKTAEKQHTSSVGPPLFVGENSSPYLNSTRRKRLTDAPPDTLGAAALALHYANIIIVIEKFVASPHLIGQDAREDLYNMLPTSVRAALRAKLKPYAKILIMSGHDMALAEEWNEAMLGILGWLAPLAHHMMRWQSERSFEHHHSFISRTTNVFLVQTLYYANQEKTEATIAELLVGLNYVWGYSREINGKAIEERVSNRIFYDDDSDE
ncbi:unnamed protein product [Cuscuta europaea]|uniref:Uncharacterized protein n=1 Tax=Cuscuta europaea TaxID=41803 RepID=A0A9P0ZTS8_CUSEU|nr:unnamed protein product [Cuscuta europaea]